jgi:hypothetical protein
MAPREVGNLTVAGITLAPSDIGKPAASNLPRSSQHRYAIKQRQSDTKAKILVFDIPPDCSILAGIARNGLVPKSPKSCQDPKLEEISVTY